MFPCSIASLHCKFVCEGKYLLSIESHSELNRLTIEIKLSHASNKLTAHIKGFPL